MKALFYILSIFFFFFVSAGFSQMNTHCLESKCDFQPGEQVFMFGNNVKLRSAPKIESEVLELLKIGEWVEIIEKTEFSWPYKGYDSPFYKVKYDTVEGYILGGLLSLERKTIAGNHYFFAFSKEGARDFLNIRHLILGKYSEQKIPLSHAYISIDLLGNQGIYDLDDILYINYQANTLSAEKGGIYFFAQDNALHRIGQLSQVSKSADFYQIEKFIFPKDEQGIPDTILYLKQSNRILDESSEWVQNSVETRKLRWMEGKLTPSFREKHPN
ncbi:MAG: SH3 domain-containing protein [Bacteroidota bacterium]